jgi:hypothetical protein
MLPQLANKRLTLQGALVGRPTGLEFMPDRDYTYCRICGVIYQPELNRVPELTAEVILAAQILRLEWSQKHARTHSTTEHRQLALSGRHCTPEALQRLVPMGIIPLTDIAFDPESEHAGLTAPRAAPTDAEGVRY